MVANLQAGARKVKEINPQAEHVLMVSSDIPGITGEMVDWVVNTDMQTDLDVYYHILEREVMETRYPGCKRTWTKLKGMEVCGADMNMGRISLLLSEETDMWEKITDARKSPMKRRTSWRDLTLPAKPSSAHTPKLAWMSTSFSNLRSCARI